MNARILLTAFCLLLAGATMSSAQAVDPEFGKHDTIYVDIATIGPGHWSLTVNYANKAPMNGFSLPLKYNAGLAKLIADSAVFAGGRVESWAFKGFRCDTAIQVLTLGGIANLSRTTHNVLNAGSGRIATIFIHASDTAKMKPLAVDTCTSSPNNTIQAIGDFSNLNLKEGEQITADMMNYLGVIPAFVVRKN